jgi:hypothetical protein
MLLNMNTPSNTRWQVAGTYFETCNCETACPCIFLGSPTEGECTVLVAWHIESGASGDTKLDGLNVVLVVHSPGHMLKGKWQVALYLDERANAAQAEALGKIFSGQGGGHLANVAPLIGEVLGVKAVPIEYHAEDKRRSLRIGQLASAEIEAVAGADGGPTTIHNQPLCISPGFPAVVSRSKRASFHDLGLELEVTEKNGLYAPFAYQST